VVKFVMTVKLNNDGAFRGWTEGAVWLTGPTGGVFQVNSNWLRR
jgi:hypothetical protein